MGRDGTALSARVRLGAGAAVVLVVGAFALTIGIGIVRGAGGEPAVVPVGDASPASTASTRGATVDEAVLYVHIAGAVVGPGLYAVSGGSRVADAIAAAGGFAEGADRAAVNLARPIVDGEQIAVPLVGESPPVAAGGAERGGACATAGGGAGPLDLNTADAAALDTLPGIGPALAERILAWRDENGPFRSVDDLLAVPGIGEKLLDGVRDGVRV